ncbi:hypothetical protein TNCV_223501 [Trichonephila clavipes]|nr:hypothetical protein TNCV_223501 [Trichonephila clavipes]
MLGASLVSRGMAPSAALKESRQEAFVVARMESKMAAMRRVFNGTRLELMTPWRRVREHDLQATAVTPLVDAQGINGGEKYLLKCPSQHLVRIQNDEARGQNLLHN